MNNFITMDRINDAVGRILLVKFNLGLFESPLADLSLINEVGSQAHRDLAREAVRKSLVLLKNGKNANESSLLPLPKKASRILVAGSHADNLGYQCGGWTISWQGFSGNKGTTEQVFNDMNHDSWSYTQIQPNHTWICQHGVDECKLDVIEACAINVWPIVETHFKFIYCVERLHLMDRHTEWRSCFGANNFDPMPLNTCYNNGFGFQLEKAYVDETAKVFKGNPIVEAER